MKKKLKKYAVQTRTILRWEKKQAYSNYKKGVAVGLVLGSLGVGVIYFLMVYLFA